MHAHTCTVVAFDSSLKSDSAFLEQAQSGREKSVILFMVAGPGRLGFETREHASKQLLVLRSGAIALQLFSAGFVF